MRTKLLQLIIFGGSLGIAGCAASEETIAGEGAGASAGSGGASSSVIKGTGNTGANTGNTGATAGSTGATGNTGATTGTGNTGATAGTGNTGATTGSSTGGAKPSGGGGTGAKPPTGGGGTGNAPPTGGGGVGGKPPFGGGGSGATPPVGGGGVGGGGTGGGGAGGTSPGGAGGSSGGTVKCDGPSLTGGTVYSKDGSGPSAGGYHYELWHDGGGTMNMTVYGVGAAFKADWDNAGDFLARVGLKWDETQTFDKYGTLAADYAYTKTGNGGGYSFIGIYGWSNDPLIEYYIVDDWFGSGPPTGGGQLKGSFEIDGGKYNIYTNLRDQKPSIHGTKTFTQFFSVRQTARQCGHISITEHFKKWDSLSMKLGKMYEAKILVEAGGGKGTINFTTATLTSVK